MGCVCKEGVSRDRIKTEHRAKRYTAALLIRVHIQKKLRRERQKKHRISLCTFYTHVKRANRPKSRPQSDTGQAPNSVAHMRVEFATDRLSRLFFPPWRGRSDKQIGRFMRGYRGQVGCYLSSLGKSYALGGRAPYLHQRVFGNTTETTKPIYTNE